jgi:tRNA A37 threonylcarbamoyladenosine dehydratase
MTAAWDYDEAFSRHAGIISKDEQEKLRDSRVAIVGMGGVGGLHLVTLGRLGIGKFAIADIHTFESANFNRQFGAQMRHVGQPKAHVMAEEVRQINPEVELRIFNQGVTDDNLADFFEGVDIFVDGIDFFSIGMRRKLFRQAARQGIYATTAGPLGFSTAWLTFDPSGMTFDEYFDLNAGEGSGLEQEQTS